MGRVQYFFTHTCSIGSEINKRVKLSCIFAKVRWYRTHARESWLPAPLVVVSPEFDVFGPSTFIPLSCIHSQCAVASDEIKFDFGKDKVIIVSPLKRKF